ncbi:UNVERIFIED_CONTAM: hypothetical protein HDU68_005958, partial [Siphonaria sp. JEL0065]
QFISLVFQFKNGTTSINQAAYQESILQEFLENPMGERHVAWRKVDDTNFDCTKEPAASDIQFMKGCNFYRQSPLEYTLEGFGDADWAGDAETRRSTTGAIMRIGLMSNEGDDLIDYEDEEEQQHVLSTAAPATAADTKEVKK